MFMIGPERLSQVTSLNSGGNSKPVLATDLVGNLNPQNPEDLFDPNSLLIRQWELGQPNSIPMAPPFVNTSNPSEVYGLNNVNIDSTTKAINDIDNTLSNKLKIEKLETVSGKSLEEILANPGMLDLNSQKELQGLLGKYSVKDLIALKDQDESVINARKAQLLSILKQFENIEATKLEIIKDNLTAMSHEKNANLSLGPSS